jgi:peptide/nickel transport system permease protein
VVGLLAKRLVAGVGVLMVLTAVVFFLRQLSPVDPARALVGAKASASVVAAERKKLGLDDPIVIQYFRYLGNVVRGNFG